MFFEEIRDDLATKNAKRKILKCLMNFLVLCLHRGTTISGDGAAMKYDLWITLFEVWFMNHII